MQIPRVLYVGPGKPPLESNNNKDFEDCSLNVKYIANDKNINEVISSFQPNSIITVGGDEKDYPILNSNTNNIRKRWIHKKSVDKYIGNDGYFCAMHQILKNDNSQMISFFTPTYNIGKRIFGVYESLKRQTYINWEWVIVDDGNDDNKTLNIIRDIASKDHRVKVYNFDEKSGGIIGESKYRAASLCRGHLLAELDHDDFLTPNCAMDLYKASQKFPDAGFFYSDCVEVDKKFKSQTYDKGFACGYGKYRKQEYTHYHEGKYYRRLWDVCNQQNINPKTIRHIVGVPNHIRVWRKETYFAVGGHNRELSLADDYELVIRTFLHTKMVHIPKLCYIQFMSNSGREQNSHDIARADIQRRVRTIMEFYNEKIAARFKELGVDDYVFKTKKLYPWDVESLYGDNEGKVNETYIE